MFGKWGEMGGPADAPQTHPLGSDSIGHLRPHPQTVAAKQAVKTCRDVRRTKLLGFKEEFGEVTFLIYAQIHGHVSPSSPTSPPNKRVLPYFQYVQHTVDNYVGKKAHFRVPSPPPDVVNTDVRIILGVVTS